MKYLKNEVHLKIIPFILAVIYFFIFNSQIYSQELPEWEIFNSSNSPLPSNSISNISVDTFNNKWIAAGGELIKISGDDFLDFSNWEVIPDLPTDVIIIQADKNGNVWMANGYQAEGLIKYDGNTFTIYNEQNSPLPYDFVSGIAVDLNNNIWIMDGIEAVTAQIYLVEFDGDNYWFQLPGNFGYQTRGDLAGIDSSDNIWTSTEFKLTRVNTITHEVTEWNQLGLGQYVTQVKSDFNGNIWIAGGSAGWGGLVRFDGQDFSYFYYSAISLAVDDQKNLWVGTQSFGQDTVKILKFDGANWIEITPYNSLLPHTYQISDLEFDKKGNLWIATSDSGIAVYKEGGIIIPVELISFSFEIVENAVHLNWTTATETNNKGFEVQRLQDYKIAKLQNWKRIGFVEGNGTTTLTHSYSYTDKNLSPGKYYYRLKQIDYDGSYEYSKEIEAELRAPQKFNLEQNYPNPFNPVTTIKYNIPDVGTSPAYSAGRFMKFIKLKVYNALGEEVATLVNEEKPAGSYSVKFDGSNFPSGVYIYRLTAGSYSAAKKLLLLK